MSTTERSLSSVLQVLDIEDLLSHFEANEITVDDIFRPAFLGFIPALVRPTGRAIRVTDKWNDLIKETQSSAPPSSAVTSSPAASVSHCSTTSTAPAPPAASPNSAPATLESVLFPESSTNSTVESQVRVILERSFTGRVILRLSKARLSTKQQGDLVKIVIDGLINTDIIRRIPSSDFDKIARAIKIIFPHEDIHDYYIPACTHPVLGRVRAKGKLLTHYHTTAQRHRPSTTTTNNNNVETADAVSAEIKTCLEFLQVQTEPWGQVVDKWSATSAVRLAVLQKERTPIFHYMNVYKCLKEPQGYKLISIDFAHLYPDTQVEWADFFERGVVALTNLRRKSDDLQSDLNLINSDDISEEAKHTLVLLNLSLLCDVVNVASKKTPKEKKSAKGVYRPSRSEIQEAFVTHVRTIGEVNPLKERRQAKLDEYDLPLLPFVVLVGLDRTDIAGAYVVFDDGMYSLHSAKRAVDICFQSFFAFWCHYPAEAHSLWLVIQKLVYKFDSDLDLVSANVMALLKQFK